MFRTVTREGVELSSDFVVVSGTHSSGKTTLMNDIAEAGQLVPEIPDAPYKNYPRYRRFGSTLLALAPEAATMYAQLLKRPEMLTHEFTQAGQVMIEWQALGLITGAVDDLWSLRQKEPYASEITHSLILADRSPLDGVVYRSLRCPDLDNELLSTVDAEREILGVALNEPAIPLKEPLGKWWRGFLRNYCDYVVLADYETVALEDNGLRLEDQAFRAQVHEEMYRAYAEVLGQEFVAVLSGNRQERRDSLLGAFVLQ